MTARIVLALVAALVAACATPPRPFTDEFYEPIRVRAGADAAPVAVFGFVDERRNTEPTVVLHYETERDLPRVDRATRPVADGVAHAFARGLRARGFTVTDATSRRYVEGQGPPGRAVVTGRVTEFGARVERSGTILQSSRQRVGCRVVLEVRDAPGGRRLFERSYSRVVEGAMMPSEPMAILARALADV
ncbi:MAG: hypothetical protein HYR51_07095, partial [Candidatus Rokubacteria bacterium]|nr:hypothetical protein [Candidatus Rokubacteria bacterium]